MLAQRQRCWADVVQMLYKCFMFAGQVREKQKTLTQCCVNVGQHRKRWANMEPSLRYSPVWA